MPGPRKLWTGPCGANLRDRAIERASTEPSSLWLVPSPLAREQVTCLLARKLPGFRPPRVWCWDDAWDSIARSHDDPPARVSPAGRMVVLSEAIERAARQGRLPILAQAAGLAGYRRLLLGRFEEWTRLERPVEGPPPGDSPATAEEWAIFGHHRAILRELGAEDHEGWSAWASRALTGRPPEGLRQLGTVVVIDPTSPTRASWRLLEHCRRWARSMIVTLPFDPEPSLAELYAGVGPIRDQFLGWGFVEEPGLFGELSLRPPGLDAIERELFRGDAHERPPLGIGEDDGLRILGGPRGEGLGLLLAREVAAQLDRGVPPEEILILVPRLDEDAERIREVLQGWDLPVARAAATRLGAVPAVSALRLAMRLPVEGWPASILVPLLRNGQVRWTDLDAGSPHARFEAASAIRGTRVFRDVEAIRRALERASVDGSRDGRPSRVALQALDQLAEVLDPVVGPGPWRVQVGRARGLAGSLGLAPDELEPLWDALDDQGWVRDGLGAAIAEESWSWADFLAQVDATVDAVEIPAPPPRPGLIRIEPVGAVDGARARVILLANLAEKTFPTPDAVDLGASTATDPAPSGPPNPGYAREMLRFARVAGSAEERLVLAFPMTDVNGEALLPAGFLDDLIRRLDGPSSRACVETHARFDPILIGHRDLARSVADARVLAVALAGQGEDPAPLRGLASSPGHRDALRGTADAFDVAHRRRVDPAFGPYDGRLLDPAAIAAIGDGFGPEHAFSPSQLEAFALCPFQFFQRYVLGLKVVDERRELDEDYAGRGSEVHRVLEQIHEQASAEGAEDLAGRLDVLIEAEMRAELETHDEGAAGLPEVLREIGTRRTRKALGRYVAQFRSYADRKEGTPTPHRFEVVFGQQADAEDTTSHPHLTIGRGPAAVKFQGKVDRIDLIRLEDGRESFRVIDYKTGSNPAGKDVLTGLASQLPLYALAVEQLVFPGGDHEFYDSGYWSLPKDGFKSVKIADWAGYRARLSTFLLSLVSEMRAGTFPIESRKKDCRKSCDYQVACRVGEVRMVGKVWAGRPELAGGGG